MHLPLTGQLTASNAAALPVPGPATLSSVHLLPFQASAAGVPDLSVPWSPTAMQRTAEVQETSFSSASVTPAGCGAFSSVKAVPFHDAASGVSPPLSVVSVESPIITQEVRETQCSSVYTVSVPRSASGTVVRAQVLPFQVQIMIRVSAGRHP